MTPRVSLRATRRNPAITRHTQKVQPYIKFRADMSIGNGSSGDESPNFDWKLIFRKQNRRTRRCLLDACWCGTWV